MKKIHLIRLLLALCLLLSACGEAETLVTEENAFTPILRVAIDEGKQKETRLFYLSESKGCFYLHPQGDGFTGGFLSTEESISSEKVIVGKKALTFAHLKETKKGQATLISDHGADLAFLKENASQNTPSPENISFENAVFFDSLTVIGETEELLVLCPVDFKETFVLAKKQADFGGLLCVTDAKKNIWYAKKDENGLFCGISCFRYGESEPFKAENFPFDSYQAIGETGVLFTRLLPDGSALYLFRDLEKGIYSSVSVNAPFAGVTCDESGKVLCGTVENETSGAVHIYDMKSGSLRGTYETEHGIPSPHLAVTPDGATLFLAVGMEKDEVIGTLNLLSFEKESKQRKL